MILILKKNTTKVLLLRENGGGFNFLVKILKKVLLFMKVMQEFIRQGRV